jgi:predicted flap endonuclease-1-like 5' DNA nuclease
MLHYLIELAVWLLAAYFSGACIGCLFRKLFGADDYVEAPVIPVAPAAPVYKPEAALPRVEVPRPVLAPIPMAAPPVAAAEPLRMARMERPRGIAMARNGKPDDLLRISGVGPKNEKILHSLGYFHFDQIASWTPENVSWVDDHLKFNGRIDREEWINQSRLLADGNDTEFTRLYGTGGEGSKEAGSRTVRGPQEMAAPSAALVSANVVAGKANADKLAADKLAADKLAAEKAVAAKAAGANDEKAAASGKMTKPKGIAKARGGKVDDLKRISGIGPKNESILHSLGFFHFDQIAAWTATEVNWVDNHLKFNGRIKREEWIRQARLLFEGKEAEFTRLYGTGGLKSKKGETLSGSRTRKS